MIFRNKSSSGFFENKYRASADPWNFAASAYEQSRYDAIMAALAHRRYRHAFEPGCSVGVLTERLAAICDTVNASDFSPSAVQQAQSRCHHLPNVTITCEALTATTRFEAYDLILLSEIGYYFKLREWRKLMARLVASASPGTTILASHWTGKSSDHRISGDVVHQVLLANNGLYCEHSESHDAFRLNRFVRLSNPG